MDHSKFNQIKAFFLDVDGVLTDGSVIVTESGELLRTMSVKDGQALKYALDKGYFIAIITKGKSKGVRVRLAGLGIKHINDNLTTKADTIRDLIHIHRLKKEEVLYMGDDIPDLKAKGLVGIFACPSDAEPEVLKNADYISPKGGGKGCVREVLRRVLKIQSNWIY
ncbi:MAG: 3-deoxy-D-manno-octulosonate 8-phosphate phosphatase [Saprospiraceae bacterium]|nr:3-deoxy-D-manno-octulosonate 8-phosphate phosphatase [Saprospiraceae bacterium]